MRKTSLTLERRERLIAALADEHFRNNDAKRFGESLSWMGSHDGQGPSAYHRREKASYPRRSRGAPATGQEWADAENVGAETDVKFADLLEFVRSELEALSPGIDDFSSDLSSVDCSCRPRQK